MWLCTWNGQWPYVAEFLTDRQIPRRLPIVAHNAVALNRLAVAAELHDSDRRRKVLCIEKPAVAKFAGIVDAWEYLE